MPYYAVANGRSKGVYTNWNQCKDQVNGYSGAQYKKFDTLNEARLFASGGGSGGGLGGGKSSGTSGGFGGTIGAGGRWYESDKVEKPSSARVPYVTNANPVRDSMTSKLYTKSVSQTTTSKTPVILGSSLSFSPNYNLAHTSSSTPKVTKIYTDGASRGNGKSRTAASGYGVYYGRNDPRNAAVPLSSVDDIHTVAPTNQRAELHAIHHALKNIKNELATAPTGKQYSIHSDSKYAMQCVDEWSNKWLKNGWTNTAGKPVANADIIKEAVQLKNEINEIHQQRGHQPLQFVHVKGHAGDERNEAADRLANIGADQMVSKINK
ncbi:conserved hypothetical protein [Lodderomyces elongisporus NRRL YB-4239]|uniref:Ribonuclease H n=1 Tax=Lodderomyces elongisporus (strain ATCC 11503 / CBS 2605 / JCM 1781 / NBRC 1676 / NRRL YB-4239) TaxID=379508 RepID=A5E5Q5_LODEL|nr:conserved hypothetical protein [Lodderomyces elongisporus NRRL YB-4239]